LKSRLRSNKKHLQSQKNKFINFKIHITQVNKLKILEGVKRKLWPMVLMDQMVVIKLDLAETSEAKASLLVQAIEQADQEMEEDL
jgi:hypothetical protein